VIALVLCILAFLGCYQAGRRSLGQGLIAVLSVGYFYGILRANLLTSFSHFIFDAGLIGFYLSARWQSSQPSEARRSELVRLWTALLIIWPILMVLMPFQPLLISLVGLRGNVFLIPMLLLGSKLKQRDLLEVSAGFAVLNLIAIAFAGAEYFTSVQQFFPISPVTSTIYSSGDVAGGFFRIPAIFSSAAAYGATMVFTLPYLFGFWNQAEGRIMRLLALSGIAAALLGVLMSATRSNFIFACAMVLFIVFTTRAKVSSRLMFIVLIAVMGVVALTNVRFQRFKTLSDTDYVSERIAGSVNRGFWEILMEHPMGNGLGGGGTSIPYFLEGQVRNPIGMENEYARILCEQGAIGLLLWVSFLCWFFCRARTAFAKGPWTNCRRLVWCFTGVCFATAGLGTGLLASIPATVIMLLGMGYTASPMGAEASQPDSVKAPAIPRQPHYRPAYTG
jgi:hypothetical protein